MLRVQSEACRVTETAMLRARPDMLQAADARQATFYLVRYIYQPLSIVSTIRQPILQRLQLGGGSMSTVPNWTHSFRTVSTQRVVYEDHLSVSQPVPAVEMCGLYRTVDATERYLLNQHQYAEDSRISRVNDCSIAVDQIAACSMVEVSRSTPERRRSRAFQTTIDDQSPSFTNFAGTPHTYPLCMMMY